MPDDSQADKTVDEAKRELDERFLKSLHHSDPMQRGEIHWRRPWPTTLPEQLEAEGDKKAEEKE